jgi:hypothetical protein
MSETTLALTPAQRLPKPATSQLAMKRRLLRELWSPAEREKMLARLTYSQPSVAYTAYRTGSQKWQWVIIFGYLLRPETRAWKFWA